METVMVLLTLMLMLLIGLSLVYFLIRSVVEPVFIMAYQRPLYIHFYPFRKKLHPLQHSFLTKNHAFYRRLSPRYQAFFGHRVSCFLERYRFIGRDGLTVTDAMKLQVAATSVMLTFGLRNYLHRSLSVIVIYPDAFLSSGGNYHKGEFNPAAGAVVFSWRHFLEGLELSNDNLNLGLHEFTHVMHFDARRYRGTDGSTGIYIDAFRQIVHYLGQPENRDGLVAAGYFREYAYTNEFEFIAVVLEHFFETPAEFREKFPELYRMVRKMINYQE